MIDLYYWPTPNGWKISIALEEMELEYRVIPVNIGRGGQFEPDFLAISPNNRMPAIVDNDPPGGGDPISVFESGAILIYLAEKSGRFLPTDLRRRIEVLEWLMWQMGGQGPMFGQAGHFRFYATEQIPYAKERYDNEMHRLYGVLDRRLAGRDFIAGDYSIADMACWPWVITYKRQEVDLDAYPNVKRWYKALQTRPALRRGYDVGRELGRPTGTWDEETRKNLTAHPNPAGR
ncbi:MAG TPA: glutathione S-transferase N-terminal domain-containing protein [Alphaproteobacteria bacterium]|nr:glutathione S-transferase N-terminal domain-containing protein [Alphaproteobacteria bacterium]